MNYSNKLLSDFSDEFHTWVESAVFHDTNKVEQPISELVDSPIEGTLLLATVAYMRLWGDNVVVTKRGKPESLYFYKQYTDPIANIIIPQLQIDKYRVDFFLTNAYAKDVKLIVECDGHDYHERTKQQAQRDKARDRHFQKEGYTVLRYTGSEIFRSPFKCAAEVTEMLASLISRSNAGKRK